MVVTKAMLVFREQSQQGNLMVNFEKALALIQENFQISKEEALEVLLKCEEKGYIQSTIRQFGNIKTLIFLSIHLQFLSLESILWVLKSLAKDEMCPLEKAIQSRIKEAFGIKVNSVLWEQILE